MSSYVRSRKATGSAAHHSAGTPDSGRASASAPAGASKTHRRGVTFTGWQWALGAIFPLLILAMWWLVTDQLNVFTPVQLPPPQAIFESGLALARDGELSRHIGISVQRVLLGFGFGAVAGVALGALLGLSRFADLFFHPTVSAFRAVPSLAWVPLILLWVGIGEDGKVLLIAIGAFFPVFTAVQSALRFVDPQIVEAGRAFGYHGVRLLGAVQLPAALPPIFSGLRLGLAQAWLFLVAAELLASSEGLGFLLTESQANGRTDRLLLAIVLLAVLGTASNFVLGVIERRMLKRWT